MPITLDGSGSLGGINNITTSASVNISGTELGYLDNTTSAIQSQLGGKADTTGNSAWTSYAPSWAGATTNPAIGNGTLTGRYVRLGKIVIAKVQILAGSTTTFGSGYWSLTTPSPASSTLGVNASAYGMVTDVSANLYSLATTAFQVSSSSFAIQVAGAAGNSSAIGATSPFTWANGDFLTITIIYEEA